MNGYCVKCKAKREIDNIEKTNIKKNHPMIKGHCKTCKTKVSVFVKKENETK